VGCFTGELPPKAVRGEQQRRHDGSNMEHESAYSDDTGSIAFLWMISSPAASNPLPRTWSAVTSMARADAAQSRASSENLTVALTTVSTTPARDHVADMHVPAKLGRTFASFALPASEDFAMSLELSFRPHVTNAPYAGVTLLDRTIGSRPVERGMRLAADLASGSNIACAVINQPPFERMRS
jgi:hypothetical protein